MRRVYESSLFIRRCWSLLTKTQQTPDEQLIADYGYCFINTDHKEKLTIIEITGTRVVVCERCAEGANFVLEALGGKK